MSMLAGPRQKQRVINLRAKNNAWSNDKNKFGQKLLEKMGWSEGKGLGMKENGIVDHVVAKYKNDDKGLGYVDRNDQWTKHEDDFNALLANLSNETSKVDLVPSGVSLEKKSKKSKARIHYHKFTRGKDLSRYSDKDLANIFGKKTLKNSEKNVPKEEDSQTEKKFTDKGSMDDYFKKKLSALKSKSQLSTQCDSADQEDTPDYIFQGFSNTSNGVQGCDSGYNGFGYGCLTNGKTITNTDKNKEITKSSDKEEPDVKPKKKKKSKCNSELQNDQLIDNLNECTVQEISPTKSSSYLDVDVNNSHYKVNCDLPKIKHKKKKSKKKDQLLHENVEMAENINGTELENNDAPIKMRKKERNTEKCENDQFDEQRQKVKRKKNNNA